MMRLSARSSIKTMETLNKDHPENFSEWHLPYHILAVTALELLAKVVLIRGWAEGVEVSETDKHLRKFGHDLSKLYSQEEIGTEFLERVGILRVEKVQNPGQFVFHYAVYLIDEPNDPIYVYDMESLRYGLISEYKSNAEFVAYQTDKLLELCKSVQDAELRTR